MLQPGKPGPHNGKKQHLEKAGCVRERYGTNRKKSRWLPHGSGEDAAFKKIEKHKQVWSIPAPFC